MIRTFAKDSLVYGVATVATRATSLVVVPIYTRFLSPTDYGVIDVLTIAGNLVLLTVALEISQAVARFLPDASSEERVVVASTALTFSVGAYAVFGIAALLVAPELSTTLVGGVADAGTIRLAVIATCLLGIFQLTSGVLRFQLRASQFAIASFASSLVAIVLGVVLVAVAAAGVDGFFIGQIVGGLVGIALTLAFSPRTYRPIFDRSRFRSMLLFSAPLVPSSIGVFVSLFVDRLAISQLMTVADVGVFGIGYRLASTASLLSLGAQMAVTPLIYARYRDPTTPLALERLFRYFVAAALMFALGLSLFAPEILRVLTTPNYYAGASVVPLLVPALFLANLYVFMPGLGIAKRTAAFAAINLSGAVVNLVLNFLLIPFLGIVGGALATLITAAAVFAAYAVGSQREYPVPHQWGRLAGAAAAISVLYVVVIQFDLGPVALIGVKVGALALAFGAIAAVGLLRPGSTGPARGS